MAQRSSFGILLASALLWLAPALASCAQQSAEAPPTVFRTNVRRVLVDVIVTDKDGKPVPELKREDFSVAEDGKPQQILSLDSEGFDPGMDYLPPKLPAEPPNTFVNLPATPEKGPLYVLLYDLVNMDPALEHMSLNEFSIQISARQQIVKFIKSKPEGARFAVFVRSDGLHLVQGFTSDKAQLLATLSPEGPHPAIPKVFMMAQNYGKGDALSAMRILGYIAGYLNGLSGRKNLIWFSASFPVDLFPSQDAAPEYIEETRKTLDLLAQDQIAIYPVDATGVVVGNPHAPTGSTGGGGLTSDARDKGIGDIAPAAAAASNGTSGGQGYSLISNSYMVQNDIAQATGGRSFHGNNDLADLLLDATQDGASYYTLTYAPSNGDYNGKVRRIEVSLAKKGYTLSYRRAYFGGDTQTPINPSKSRANIAPPPRALGDTLYANMEHGAPVAHQLIFGAHLRTIGTPAMGTSDQMAQLAIQPAYFKVRRRTGQPVPLAPMRLQRYAVDYTVMAHQLQISGEPVNLELAVAAYDADGRMLNADVGNGASGFSSPAPGQSPPKSYRAELQLEVPLEATWVRVAIRDANTDRIGAMEIKLPLAPESEAAGAATKAR